jgi:hypothetical protein
MPVRSFFSPVSEQLPFSAMSLVKDMFYFTFLGYTLLACVPVSTFLAA